MSDLTEGLFIRDDDEDLFSRDIDGQLVRLDSPTESDYEATVTLQIDGQSVTVPRAEPLKDAQGNIVQDVEGQTTPRYTTIYDAAVRLYVEKPGDEVRIPIPTLCHQEHMQPVGVCRLCVVQIYGQKRGRRAAERKLLPACQHQVKDGMEVFTMNAPGPDGDRVRQTVKTVTELLTADHLKLAEPPELGQAHAPFNELGRVSERCGAIAEHLRLDVFSDPPPPAPPEKGRRKFDSSSPVFLVDHSACILCDRCVRACGEVQQNHVIGRTGKGANAGISFDLNDPMGESSCVQCGECMVSCPTSAIIFKPGTRVHVTAQSRTAGTLEPRELLADPIFAGISPKFLLWQGGLVVRRRLRAGELLCRQGEAGNTAFLIKEGTLEVSVTAQADRLRRGQWFRRGRSRTMATFLVTPDDVVVGEMSCITGTPRTATVRAKTDAEVWEIRRNVLDRLMRLPSLNRLFEERYRDRMLNVVLWESDLFKNLEADIYGEIVDFLRPRLAFVRVRPGQILFKQGDRANALYLVRLGHVRVGIRSFASESKLISLGPGSIVGEIGLLGLSPQDVSRPPEEVEAELAHALAAPDRAVVDLVPAGLRTSTCSALGNLEMARLDRADFLEMIRDFPPLRRRLVELSLARLRSNESGDPLLQEFVDQGLYEGRSILALDLDRCTRCDECTRGCVQQHGEESHGQPVTRLLRDGMRFDKYLIATSCRSCVNPHCMVGCPVDSIHRGANLQIVIEDHCIGCGLCADNCPYGSISLVPNLRGATTATPAALPLKAANCDLCENERQHRKVEPQCVASCPHDAAFRLTGDELLQRVLGDQR